MTVLKLFRKVAPIPGKSAIPLCPHELAAEALGHAFRVTPHADPLRRVFHNRSARIERRRLKHPPLLRQISETDVRIACTGLLEAKRTSGLAGIFFVADLL